MKISLKKCLAGLAVFCLLFLCQAVKANETEDLKAQIYSKIKCCNCSEPFAQCACPEAKQIKGYIDALIDTGVSKEDIFYKLGNKFTVKIITDPQIKASVERKIIAEAGENRPQVVLDPVSFDFGDVSKKQGKSNKTFKVFNKGKENLVIKDLRTSCPCTIVALDVHGVKSPYFETKGAPAGWQAEIKPGEAAQLDVILDLLSPHVKTGEVIRDVTIKSNDPLYPEVTVIVKAKVSD